MKIISQQRGRFIHSFCGPCVSCSITDCFFKLFCSCWELDSSGMVGSSFGPFLMSSCDVPVLVYNILLTLMLSVSIGFHVPNTVALGMWTISYVGKSMGLLSDCGYLWLILWSIAKGIKPKGRWCQVHRCVMCLTWLVFELLLLIYFLIVGKMLLHCKLFVLYPLMAC